MKLLLIVVLSVLAIAASTQELNGWKLIWQDEFDGHHVDKNKWQFQIGTKTPGGPENWGNNEAQYYTEQNTQVKDGKMIITAKREDYHGKKYTSSRLWTKPGVAPGFKGFSTKYGRIEAKISLPVGITGMWPAFWMLPVHHTYGSWAASGEIDIMEAKGRHKNKSYGTIHYGGKWPKNEHKGGQYYTPSGQDLTSYHVYAIEWEHGKIRWYIDGKEFFSANSWWSTGGAFPAPFNVDFYIILNLAVGGDFDGGQLPPHGFREAQMKIEYVRCYTRDSNQYAEEYRNKSIVQENQFINEAQQVGYKLVEAGLLEMDTLRDIFLTINTNVDALQFVMEAEILKDGKPQNVDHDTFHYLGEQISKL